MSFRVLYFFSFEILSLLSVRISSLRCVLLKPNSIYRRRRPPSHQPPLILPCPPKPPQPTLRTTFLFQRFPPSFPTSFFLLLKHSLSFSPCLHLKPNNPFSTENYHEKLYGDLFFLFFSFFLFNFVSPVNSCTKEILSVC